MENRAALEGILNERFGTAPVAHWVERLREVGVPAGPIHDVGAMHRDPQTLARDMVVESDHPVAGRVKGLGAPVKFSAGNARLDRPAPLYAEHTAEVLLDAGFTQAEIDGLAAEGAIHLHGD